MNNVRYIFIVSLLLVAFSVQAEEQAEESEWLGDDYAENSLGLRFGSDSDSGELMGVDVSLASFWGGEVTASYFRSDTGLDVRDDEFDNLYIVISTDPYATWATEITYEYSGNDQVLEASDVQIAVQYYPGGWLIKAGYIRGEIDSHFDARAAQLLDVSSETTDRDGYSLDVSVFLEGWSFGLSGQDLDYDRDLSAVQTDRRLQLILGEQTITQMFTLTDWRIDANVFFQWRQGSVGVGVTRYQLIVDSEEENNLYFTIDQLISDDVRLAFLLARSTEEDSLTYGEFSLRYHW